MKPTIRILVIFFAFLISACSSVQDTESQHNQYSDRYSELVEIVKIEPSINAVTELRQVYVLTDRYEKNIVSDKVSNPPLFMSMVDENWSLCLDKSAQALERNYISLTNHYKAMVCSLESGKSQQSAYHESMLNMLLEAIWTTGDGQSIQTAFFSTSMAEIDAFIEFHGLEIISRSLIQNDDKSFDVVTLNDAKNAEQFKWYFDITAQLNLLKALTKD